MLLRVGTHISTNDGADDGRDDESNHITNHSFLTRQHIARRGARDVRFGREHGIDHMEGVFELLQLMHDAEADFVMMRVVIVVREEHCILMVIFLCIIPVFVVVGLRASKFVGLLY